MIKNKWVKQQPVWQNSYSHSLDTHYNCYHGNSSDWQSERLSYHSL